MSTDKCQQHESDQAHDREPSEPESSKRTEDKDVPYWVPNIDNMIKQDIRDLLINYSGILPEEIRKHVYDTREKAWSIRAYPCTGAGLWLQPILPLTQGYQHILERMKLGASFMDIGCFMGVDLRRLVFDGAPSRELYAVDIVSHWDVGFDFFHDRDRFSAHYIDADVLKADKTELAKFQGDMKAPQGRMDFVSICHVLHQFSWNTQRLACVQMARLTKGPGSMVLGWQIGTKPEGPHHNPVSPSVFLQNAETMNKLWQEVAEMTDTRWKVQTGLHGMTSTGWIRESISYLGEDVRLISFVAERLN